MAIYSYQYIFISMSWLVVIKTIQLSQFGSITEIKYVLNLQVGICLELSLRLIESISNVLAIANISITNIVS